MAFVSLKDAVVDYIKTKLAANTQGVTFEVGVDIKQAQERYEKLSTPTYSEDDFVELVPCMLDVEDTPKGNPKTDKTDFTIFLTFSMSATDDADSSFVKEKTAVEELRKAIRQDPSTFFIVDEVTYNAYFNPTFLSRNGALEDQAGYIRPQMVMSIAVRAGIGLVFFNVDEKYEIKLDGTFDWTELDFITCDESVGVEYDTSHPEDEDIAIGVPNRAVHQVQGTLDYNSTLLAHRFLRDVTKKRVPFDTIIEMRVTQDTGGDPDLYNMNVQGTRVGVSGVENQLVLTFTEAEA